ncbi:MAG: hypothetical protein ACRC2V_20205, partial [Xenococcaceae cyanobacterium]
MPTTSVRRVIFDAWLKAIAISTLPFTWLLEEPTAKADVIPKPPVKTRPKPLPPSPKPPPISQPDIVQNYENTTIVQNTQNNQVFITNNYNFSPVLAPQVQNPINIPPRRLPKESDGQTVFNTPVGKSIAVKEALTERSFGRLLHRPLNRKKLEIPIVPTANIKKEFEEKSKAALEKIAEWLTTQETGIPPEDDDKKFKFWDTAALISATSIRGFTGDIGFLYGMEPLHLLARECMRCSLNAFQEVSGLIPIEYEVIDYDPKTENKYQETEQEFTNVNSGLLNKIHKILGGSLWDSEPILNGEFYLEDSIRFAGFEQYKEGKDDEYKQNPKLALEVRPVNIRHLPDLLAYSVATLYYRAGFHRFPAEVPETLLAEDPTSKKKDEVITISDTLHFQEWTIEQLDALIGQFPIQFKYKDVEGKEQQLKLNNLAETLAELVGLSISIATDSDTSVALGIKTLTEAVKASNSSILAADYAKANADYLGYKGKQFVRDVPVSFTPNKESLRELLKDSTLKLASWKYEGQDDLQEQIGKLLIVSQIVKAALFQPFKPDGKLTGDDIKKQKEKDKEEADKQWQEFVTQLNNPAGIFKT